MGLGTTETFTLTLDGTNAGVFTTTITINNDDSDEGSFTYPVTGEITTPEISIFVGTNNSGSVITSGQTAVIDCGSALLGNDITQTFAIENGGTSALNILGIVSSTADFTVNSTISSIAVGVTENFSVVLSGDNVGTFNTIITIASNDKDEALFSYSISGTINALPASEIGVFVGEDNSGLALTSGQVEVIDIGSTLFGNDLIQTFAIENTGNIPLNVSDIAITGTGYTIRSTISSVAVGATATFDVILSGDTPGIFESTVTISSND